LLKTRWFLLCRHTVLRSLNLWPKDVYLNTEVLAFVRDLLTPSSTYKIQAQLVTKIGFTNDYSVNGVEMKKDQKEEEDEEEQIEDK